MCNVLKKKTDNMRSFDALLTYTAVPFVGSDAIVTVLDCSAIKLLIVSLTPSISSLRAPPMYKTSIRLVFHEEGAAVPLNSDNRVLAVSEFTGCTKIDGIPVKFSDFNLLNEIRFHETQ